MPQMGPMCMIERRRSKETIHWYPLVYFMSNVLERFLGEENESNASDGTRVQDCSEDALNNDGRISKYSFISVFE